MTDDLKPLAEKVLRDPMLLRQLSDRVYVLMTDALRHQRDRDPRSSTFIRRHF